MTEAAVSRWLADHLSGEDTVLLVTTNAQAAEPVGARRNRTSTGVGNAQAIAMGDGGHIPTSVAEQHKATTTACAFWHGCTDTRWPLLTNASGRY